MKTLHIDVVDKVANYREDDGAIVCGNSDYQIEFNFDAEWGAHDKKTARFIYGNTYKDVEFTGNVCTVPLLVKAHEVFVGVFVTDELATTTTRIPATFCVLCNSATGNNEKPVIVESGTKLYRHYMTSFDLYAIEIISTSKKPFQISQSSDGVVGLPIEDGTTLVSALVWTNPNNYKSATLNVDRVYILGESITEQLAITNIEGTSLTVMGFSGDTVTEL